MRVMLQMTDPGTWWVSSAAWEVFRQSLLGTNSAGIYMTANCCGVCVEMV